MGRHRHHLRRYRRTLGRALAICLVAAANSVLTALLIAAIAPLMAAAASPEFSGLVDIGGGRKMYMQCRGTASPTVVLVAGYVASASDREIAKKPGPAVFPEVAKSNRAYDRPGTAPL